MKRAVQVVIIIVIAYLAWKHAVPWFNEHIKTGSEPVKVAGPGDSGTCAQYAERASNTWGSGLGRFVNPPYDLAAWGAFRSQVTEAIGLAEAQCLCAEEGCRKVREAMGDLRSLVSDMDTAIRNGTPPPSDVVQRQERIDNTIEAAKGKT